MVRRFFTHLQGASATERAAGTGTRRPHRSRPALEALERRSLLSLAGSLHQVSTLPGDNNGAANASSANGTSVIVWINATTVGGSHVEAQRFDAQGEPTGSVISVDGSRGAALEPVVATDASERFVVAWQEHYAATGRGAIEMRVYSAAGIPLTGVTRVSTGSTGSDGSPSVAASAGSFVVAYQRRDGADDEVLARRYTDSSGAPVAHPTLVVDRTGLGNSPPSVAMASDGRFDVAYEHESGPGNDDIDLARYSAAGARLGTSKVNVDARPESEPSVAMDRSGNAVVAYVEAFGGFSGVLASRVAAAGIVAPAIEVPSGFDLNHDDPSVALSPTTGAFVLADFDSQRDAIDVAEFAPGDSVAGDYDVSSVDAFKDEASPSVSVDGYGRVLLTYTARPGPSDEVYGRRALLPTDPTAPMNMAPFISPARSPARNASSADGTSVVVWVSARSPSDPDIEAQRFDAQGRPMGPAIVVDGSAADSYAPAVAMDASGRFIVAWEDYTSAGGGVIEMRAYSAAGAPLTAITRVSTMAKGSDGAPSVAASVGSFVVVYEHDNGAEDDVLARRYTYSPSAPVAHPTFAVAATARDESSPSMAMTPDGRFDIAYADRSFGRDGDIELARYSAAGASLGNSPINTDPNDESEPSVAMDDAGNAVVAYVEALGATTAVFANRVTAAGAVGPRISVSDDSGDDQAPSVALSPTTGAFVVAFETTHFSIGDPFFNVFVPGFYAVEFSAADTALEPLFEAAGYPDDGSGVSVSIDGHDRYLVTSAQRDGLTDEVDSLRDFLAT
jgi:hypothetical protein